MGFMDDLKKAAKEVGEGAKKAAAQGKEKVEDLQTKRKMDEAAEKLGYLYYREKTENVPAGSDAATLVEEITRLKAQLEADKGPEATTGESPPAE
jgi:hypothetical protein